jgi:hypothetical protein
MTFAARLSLAVVLCLPAAPLFAAEGVLLVEKVTTGTKVTTSQVQWKKTGCAPKTNDASGAKQAIVFDGSEAGDDHHQFRRQDVRRNDEGRSGSDGRAGPRTR